jgi:hemolysin activation/secretion protein
LTASYPITRRTDTFLDLAGNYDHKHLKDRTVAGESSNRQVRVFAMGIDGYTRGLGGVVSFGAGYTHGNSEQRNETALATDSTTRRVQGDFNKLKYKLGWRGRSPQVWSLNATLSGQVAGDNLDSSEQFSLGGPHGIRAYPVGEASGDEGWLLRLNLVKRFGDSLNTSLFYDAGGIRMNHTLWSDWNASNPDLPNTYTLRGAGAGVHWRINKVFSLTSSIATPIGDNPGANAEDHNVDGKANKTHAWLKLSAKL